MNWDRGGLTAHVLLPTSSKPISHPCCSDCPAALYNTTGGDERSKIGYI